MYVQISVFQDFLRGSKTFFVRLFIWAKNSIYVGHATLEQFLYVRSLTYLQYYERGMCLFLFCFKGNQPTIFFKNHDVQYNV